MKGFMKTMENNINTFAKDLQASTEIKHYKNRKEYRRIFGGKHKNFRSKAPRNIASRKVLPMPIGWEGWKDWKPKRKAV